MEFFDWLMVIITYLTLFIVCAMVAPALIILFDIIWNVIVL